MLAEAYANYLTEMECTPTQLIVAPTFRCNLLPGTLCRWGQRIDRARDDRGAFCLHRSLSWTGPTASHPHFTD
jgi:hypothetical protein